MKSRCRYQSVFGDVSGIIDAARRSATRSVNAAMAAVYKLIGRHIVEFAQSGEVRAEYEATLMGRLSADLTVDEFKDILRETMVHVRPSARRPQ